VVRRLQHLLLVPRPAVVVVLLGKQVPLAGVVERFPGCEVALADVVAVWRHAGYRERSVTNRSYSGRSLTEPLLTDTVPRNTRSPGPMVARERERDLRRIGPVPCDAKDMTSPAWMAVEERLSGTLVALADGGTLIVGEPAAPPQPRQGLFRQRPKPPPTRYVQYLRSDRYLACECVGASSFGGDIPLTVEQDDAIRTLGWRLPSDGSDAEPPPSYPNYHRTVPLDEAGEAARLGVGALAALGLRPEDLNWERG